MLQFFLRLNEFLGGVKGRSELFQKFIDFGRDGLPLIENHLFDLLHTLELDEKDYGIDLVLMEPLHKPKMNVQDAMLILRTGNS